MAYEEAEAGPTARPGARVKETLSGASLRELLIGGAHLGALWAFAFVQPLLDLLGKNADFWVARSNTSGDILIFSIAFTLLPPIAILVAEAIVKMASERAYRVLHLGLVALLFAVFAVQIEKRIYSRPASLMIVIALALGALFAYGLYKRGFVKQLLDVLTPAPIVFLALFIFFSDTHKLIFPAEDANALGVKVKSDTPVVMLVFDELPTATLMEPSGQRIDERRFPGFASLAAQSTWYRNNSTVGDFTGRAVPAIETGVNPGFTTLPISSDQPNSIFSLLGGQYRFNVSEVVTEVCPPSLCGSQDATRPPQRTRLRQLADDLLDVEGRLILPPALANKLPNVSATFGNFGNNEDDGQFAGNFAQDLFVPPSAEQFDRFFRRIRGGRSLNFIHIELPHEPFRFLADGRRYNFTPISDVAGPNAQKWAAGEGGVAMAQQRHFIQTGYADNLARRMIRTLKQEGVWHKALVIVTADHGISFDQRNFRRIAYRGNFGGVANPPLFIKYPGQRKGKVSDVHTRTIDIVPTVAQVLGIDMPYKTDGRPVSEDGRGGPVTISNGLKTTVTQPFARMLTERREILRQNALRLGPHTGLYQLGPRSDLLGRPAPPVTGAGSAGTATLNKPEQWRNVSFAKDIEVPAFAAATLEGVRPGSLIAIAVNGRVAATCRAFLFNGETWAGAVVPPATLHRGQNSVGVYLIGPGDRLAPLGGT